MSFSIIVAVSENNVIGRDNRLIWHLPADMKFFKEKTMGHAVITGRKNYESIPEKFRPLLGRTNIIVTRQKKYHAPGAFVVSSIEKALQVADEKNPGENFIIGGAEIFNQTISLCDKIYLTRVHEKFDGDVFFGSPDMNRWKLQSSEEFKADEKNKFDMTFEVWVKKKM